MYSDSMLNSLIYEHVFFKTIFWLFSSIEYAYKAEFKEGSEVQI